MFTGGRRRACRASPAIARVMRGPLLPGGGLRTCCSSECDRGDFLWRRCTHQCIDALAGPVEQNPAAGRMRTERACPEFCVRGGLVIARRLLNGDDDRFTDRHASVPTVLLARLPAGSLSAHACPGHSVTSAGPTSNSGRRAARASPPTSNYAGSPPNTAHPPHRQSARVRASRAGYRVERTCAHMDVRTKLSAPGMGARLEVEVLPRVDHSE